MYGDSDTDSYPHNRLQNLVSGVSAALYGALTTTLSSSMPQRLTALAPTRWGISGWNFAAIRNVGQAVALMGKSEAHSGAGLERQGVV